MEVQTVKGLAIYLRLFMLIHNVHHTNVLKSIAYVSCEGYANILTDPAWSIHST